MSELPPDLYLYFTLLVVLGGAAVGSFLNVCIYRIPLDQSIVKPRSHCPKCGAMIAWYDNIPVLSYLFLRGQCRHCKAPISPRYALVESLTAIFYLAVWLTYGFTVLTPIYFLVIGGLILATFVDLDHLIIPDRVSIGGMLAGLICSAAFPVLHDSTRVIDAVFLSLIGLVVGAGSLWLVAVLGKMAFRKDAMGLGDVKLLGAIGAFMGWEGVLFTIMLSSLAGSLMGLFFIFTGRHEWQSRIPYGPYLALAAVIWILWGMEWWQAYLTWMSGG